MFGCAAYSIKYGYMTDQPWMLAWLIF